MKPLIALYSPAMGSGKTTAAQYLEAAYDFHRLGFADPIKKMTRALLESAGVEQEHINAYVAGHLKEKPVPFAPVTARKIMQTLGTEWGRQTVYENIWVEALTEKAEELLFDGEFVVVDDLRFPNEYEDLRRMGATLIRINRPTAECGERHESEGALDDFKFDQEINNDGSINALYGAINSILMEDM